jgi:transcriptional regulator with XRE-family HTH domain
MHGENMNAHQRLQEARKFKGYTTPTDAARENGWTISTYLAHENGSRGLTLEAAARYADAFGCDPGWLAFGATASPPQSHPEMHAAA